MRPLAALAVAALLAGCSGGSSAPQVAAAAEAVGVVDASFGIQGIATLPGDGFIEDILELADGSLLLAGGPGFVAKLTPSGRLDATFAGGGLDATRHGDSVNQRTVLLAPFPQGVVTVVSHHTSPCVGGGFCNPAAGEVVVRRIHADGATDVTYGISPGVATERLTPVAQVVSPTGRVMTFALTSARTNTNFGVVSIGAAGEAEVFGSNAREVIRACGRIVSPPDGFERPHALGAVTQGDNTLALAIWGGANGGVCVLSLTPAGLPDPAFGSGGRVIAVPSPAARSLAVVRTLRRDDGMIVVALGQLAGSTPSAFLFFTRDGHFSEQPAPAAPEFMVDATLQPNGKVVSAGYPARVPANALESPFDSARPQLWRASQAADTVDPAFGPSGEGLVPIASAVGVTIAPRRIRIDQAGRILVGGRRSDTGQPAVIRIR